MNLTRNVVYQHEPSLKQELMFDLESLQMREELLVQDIDHALVWHKQPQHGQRLQ
jgi:hypothetical protein